MNDVGSPEIAILGGTGALGFALAKRLCERAIPVVIGSRDRQRAHAAAERLRDLAPGAPCDGLENAAAAAAAPIVALTVPFSSQAEIAKSIAAALPEGAIVLDATVPVATAVGGKPTRTLGVWQGSAAQQALELLPAHVSVVAGLHTISAVTLADTATPLTEHALLTGDDKDAVAAVAALLRRIGLASVHCGKLELARITEQMTALMIAINIRHKTHAGIKVVGVRSATQ